MSVWLFSRSVALLSKIGFKLAALILAIFIVVFIFPTAIVILTPIYVFRLIVLKLTPYVQPSLGKILTTRSTNFSCDRMYESPECLILISITMEGNLPIKTVNQLYCDKVLKEKLPNGDLRYPELMQYPVDWFGFRFWKKVTNFDISNHVTCYNPVPGNPVTDLDLCNIRQELLKKPFIRKQSPWDVTIIHDYIPSDTRLIGELSGPYSTMYLRFHHSVADGFSILKLVVNGLCDQPEVLPKAIVPPSRNIGVVAKIIQAAYFPIRSVYEFAENSLLAFPRTNWHVPRNRRTHGVHAVTNYIPIKIIKSYKKQNELSFTGVVFSACAVAMKTMMVRKEMKIPKNITCVCPFPMPGHPDKLRNHMTQGFIEFPMDEGLSPEMRMKKLHQSYEKLKRSTSPYFNNFLAVVLGSTFSSFINPLAKNLVPSVLISNFPAEFGCVSIGGHRFLDCFFACGLLEMPGIGFYILSYNEALRISVVADSSLLSKDEVIEFTRLIEKEFDLLGKSVVV